MAGRTLYWYATLLVLVFAILAGSTQADLTCSISAACGGDVRLLGVENDTGGYQNAHVQTADNVGYANSLCCSSTGQTLGTLCGADKASAFLRLQSDTGANTSAHVQDPSNNSFSTNYTYSACLSGDGTSSCDFYNGACPATHTCLGSVASSEGDDYTNAHFGNCSAYTIKVCCSMNSPPTQGTPVLNATDHPANSTAANLTAYNVSTADGDGDTVYNTYDWRLGGTSIAVLNMPFNTNISTSAADAVTDYSTFGNAGTLGGGTSSRVPTWNTTCIYGGCYTFDGQDDSVEIAADPSHNLTSAFTISAWAYLHSDHSNGRKIVAKYYAGASAQTDYTLQIYPTYANFRIRNTGDTLFSANGNEVPLNQWQHIVGVFNGSHLLLYQNGTQTDTTAFSGTMDSSSKPLLIGNAGQAGGGTGTDSGRNFNGSIDELLIFNRSLSAEQVNRLYLEGTNALESRAIVSNETSFGQTWTACLTPSDTVDDGTTTCSNQLTIAGNSAPNTPTLLLPENNNNSVLERYPVFDWTDSTDPDGNFEYYTINISAPATCAAIPLRNVTPSTYTSVEKLCADRTYNWTVRACDSFDACSAWAGQFNFTITSVLGIEFTTNETEFGTLEPSTESITVANDTRDSDPAPLVINNTGNVDENIDVRALDALWTNQPLNTTYFMYADENSTTWKNVTQNYTDFYNGLAYGTTREMEINITVPIAEPGGAKTSTIQGMVVSAE